jgi:carbon storage regulator
MLVLSREIGEKVIATIGGQRLEICVVDVNRRNGRVRLGFEAPRNVIVHREEVDLAIAEEVAEAVKKPAAPPA